MAFVGSVPNSIPPTLDLLEHRAPQLLILQWQESVPRGWKLVFNGSEFQSGKMK